MKRSMILGLYFVLSFMLHHVLYGHDAAGNLQVRFHRLFNEEQKAARNARDYAEQLRRDYQAIYAPGRHDVQEIAAPKRSELFENVVQAYNLVISQYAGTEIAATCAMRLAGFYTYGQDYETSIAVLKNAKEFYAGTPVENDIYFSLGLAYLQGKHDPEEAARWFKLIPRPSDNRTVTEESYHPKEKLYFSAQQQIAKCEFMLNRPAYTRQRYQRLMARYPDLKNSFERELRSFDTAVLNDSAIIDKELDDEAHRAVFDANQRRQRHVISDTYTPGMKDKVAQLTESIKNRDEARSIEVVQQLTHAGDDAVAPMMDRIALGASYSFAHEAINVLAGIKTETSQDALLDLALGTHFPARPDGSSWAARNYIKNLPHKAEVWILLPTRNTDVLGVAVRALHGEPLDPGYLPRLEILLQSQDSHLRSNTARLITREPNELSVRQKISLLIESLKTVHLIPDIDKKQASNMLGTQENLLYCSFIDCLSQIEGAETLLRPKVDETEGYAQWVVKIALAQMGDPTYKQDMKAFITNKDMFAMSGMRSHALRSFARIGTSDDVVFLEDLSNNDPFEVVFLYERVYELVHGEFIHEKDRTAPVLDPKWPQNSESPRSNRNFLIRYEAKRILQDLHQTE